MDLQGKLCPLKKAPCFALGNPLNYVRRPEHGLRQIGTLLIPIRALFLSLGHILTHPCIRLYDVCLSSFRLFVCQQWHSTTEKMLLSRHGFSPHPQQNCLLYDCCNHSYLKVCDSHWLALTYINLGKSHTKLVWLTNQSLCLYLLLLGDENTEYKLYGQSDFPPCSNTRPSRCRSRSG